MKTLGTLLIILLLTADWSIAQDRTPLNRWSADISVNTIMGREFDFSGSLLGSLGIDSQYLNPHLSAGLRYAFTPSISGQANLSWVRLTGDENRHPNHPYTTQMGMFSLQGNVYFLRAFESYRISQYVNPYFYLGGGMAFGKVTNLANDNEREIYNGFFTGGFGTKFYVTDRFDFFMQYNYVSFKSERIDGYPNITSWYRGSRLAGYGFGISIKIGPKNQPHSDWHIGHSRIDEAIQIARNVETRQTNLERRVDSVEIVQEAHEVEHAETRSRLEILEEERDRMRELDGLIESQYETNLKIQLLIDRVNALESRANNMPAYIQRIGGDYVLEGVERGYYVQVYAGARYHHADGAKAIIRELFEDVHGVHNLNYIIHKPHQYYVVQIGPYDELNDTDEILRKAREVFDDSFIRHYPRTR